MSDFSSPLSMTTVTGAYPLLDSDDARKRRCFVTSVQVDKPHMNRLVSTVSCREDNGGLECSFPVVDGSKFSVGQVVWVTVSLKGD